MDYYSHPTSIIEPDAIIGKGSKIWHFSHVMDQVIIGINCILGQNVFVGKQVKIGNHVKIQNNVSVYSGVTLEDNVFVGPSVVFTNVNNPRSWIERKNQFIPTIVKFGTSIGANATIICGVKLGRFCFVGAGSIITKDVPDYALVYGNPTKNQGWVCECGEKLGFSDSEKENYIACLECSKNYKRIGNKVSRIRNKVN